MKQRPEVQTGACELLVQEIGEASSLEEAWRLLPEQGEGVLMLADRVCRFNPKNRGGLLLEGDVVDGRATVILRQAGSGWKAWRWEERSGESHRYFERAWLSSERPEGAPRLLYRTYWTLVEDDGLKVWSPTGSRFCGFQEA